MGYTHLEQQRRRSWYRLPGSCVSKLTDLAAYFLILRSTGRLIYPFDQPTQASTLFSRTSYTRLTPQSASSFVTPHHLCDKPSRRLHVPL